MSRPAKTLDRGFPQRLKVAIRETGMTQEEFAASIDTTGHNVSRWVTGAQAPDAPGMAKLARGLKERFIWVLTGEEPLAIDQRTVGSLPLEVRNLVESALECSPELQRVLELGARLFKTRPSTSRPVRIVQDAILEFDDLLQDAKEVAPNDPLIPEEHPSN